MSTISSCRSIENKHDVYRGKHSMKKCTQLKIIHFKKKKMEFLTKEKQESYENAKIYHICKKIEKKYFRDNTVKLEIIVITQGGM